MLTTWSTMPYAAASSALNQRSRSLSRVICSTVWPVCSACSSLTRRLTALRFAAWTSTSAAVPWMPADGWCIMIRALGRANRLPGVPAPRRNWPMQAANPTARVETSLGMSRIVS